MGTDEFLRYLTARVHVDDYPLLRNLTEPEVKEVLHSGTIVRAQKGNLVIRTGDPGQDMYMVMTGVLEVRARSTSGRSHVIETLGKGQVFGEMSFLNGRPRTADVAAVTDAEVLLITRDFLDRLMRGAPVVASRLPINLSMYLVDRLQNTTRNLVDAMGRGETTAAPQ
jgi:CRP-like cAMP-binding protein